MRVNPSLSGKSAAKALASTAIVVTVIVVVVKEVATDFSQQIGEQEVTETCGSLACSPAWSVESFVTLALLLLVVLVASSLATGWPIRGQMR